MILFGEQIASSRYMELRRAPRVAYTPGINSARRIFSCLYFFNAAIMSLISLSESEPPDSILFTPLRITSADTKHHKRQICLNLEWNHTHAQIQGKRVGKPGNIVSATKMFLNLFGNIFASWEANFVSATMFPEVSNRETLIGNIMFPQHCFNLDKALDQNQ